MAYYKRIGQLIVFGCLLVSAGFAGPILNPGFETGASVAVSYTGSFSGGPSAADNWGIWNNPSGTTTTALCPLSTCVGAPAPFAGSELIHITTTTGNSGITQVFTVGLASSLSVWLQVVSGSVYMAAIGPDGTFSLSTAVNGVNTVNFGGMKQINQIALYGSNGAANFYADAVSLNGVPEPTTFLLTLGGLLAVVGVTRRRRSRS